MNTPLDTLSAISTELTQEQLDATAGGIVPVVVLAINYGLEFAAWLAE